MKFLNSSSSVNESLTGQSILGHITYIVLLTSGLWVGVEKSAESVMVISLVVTCCFFFAASNVPSNLCHFTYSVSWCDPLWVNPVWDSQCFLDLEVCLLSSLGSFQLFLLTCSLLLSSSLSRAFIMWILVTWCPRCLLNYHFLFFLFSISDFHYCLSAHWSVPLLQSVDVFCCTDFNYILHLWWVFNIFFNCLKLLSSYSVNLFFSLVLQSALWSSSSGRFPIFT